ncbi:DUF5343 domain-containing protein [Aliifodinibius sp. S!AR15-10]|uniref:DUF5343 domain-containing protein n=1 Tax=Aliifodinibius sp. S!AR15-10 TaxID=2950437 RepID=UPI002861DEFE|nr:DUF5343 domain-containing protein [Aliifodinibius sp. S!AR15-10]MDR8390222.1 DUF5343 domain-containing protein [Aliifodinibius sp. S!AR15-10]
MNIFETFVTKSNTLEQALIKIRDQGVPDSFNQSFLEGLDITKPNSIHYVILFKKLGFIDEDDKPVLKYYSKFVESAEQSRAIMAARMREAYGRIFELDSEVHKLPSEKIHSLFRKVMGEEKSSTFVQLVTDTFIALSRYADWNTASPSPANTEQEIDEIEEIEVQLNDELEIIDTQVETSIDETETDLSDEYDEEEEEQEIEQEVFAIAGMENEESNGEKENSNDADSFEYEDDIAGWFKKPATPHEEFLLELMDGNSDHKYGDEFLNSAGNGKSHFNSNYTNGELNHAISVEKEIEKDKPEAPPTLNEDRVTQEAFNGPGDDQKDSFSEEIELDDQEENTPDEVKAEEPSREEPASKQLNGASEEHTPEVSKSESVEAGEEPQEANAPTANMESNTKPSQKEENTTGKRMETILQAKKSVKGDENKITYYSEYLKEALLKRANLLTELGRFEEAINAYDEIIKYASTDLSVKKEEVATAIYKKASILEKLNKFDEAVSTYDDLIQQYFDRVPAKSDE